MKQLVRLLVGLLPGLLLGCEYAPSGSHYVEVNPTPVVNININLNTPGDTLYTRGNVTYTYNIQSGSKNVYATEVWLGNQRVHQSTQKSSSFIIDTREFADGKHELKLMTLTSSGTGSLADKAGAEYLEVHRKWVMYIDNAPPTPVQITKVAAEDGTLEVEWEKYTRRYIKNFTLYRHNKDGQVVKKITFEPNITSWTDTDYIGGEAYYSIAVTDLDERSATGNRVLYHAPAPKFLSHRYENTNELVITFSSTKLYKNFGEYRLNTYYSSPMSFETSVVTDTVVRFKNIPFGEEFNFSLATLPKDPDNEYAYSTYDYLNVKGYGHENTYQPFNVSAYIPSANLFYDLSGPDLKTIDATTLQVVNQKRYDRTAYTMSANGKYLYVNVPGEGIHQLDPVSLDVINTFKLSELSKTISSNSMYLRVSNDNKLLFYFRRIYAVDSLFVMNMNTRELELKKGQPYAPYNATISPDGKMVATPSYIYRKQPDGNWSEEFKLYFNQDQIRYHQTEPLYRMSGTSPVTYYSTETGAAVKTFHFPAGVTFTGIDPATGYLTAVDNDHFYIYSPDGHTLLKKIKMTGPVSFYKDRLYNGTYYLPLTF